MDFNKENKTLKRKSLSMEAELFDLRKRMKWLEKEMMSQADTHVTLPAHSQRLHIGDSEAEENGQDENGDEFGSNQVMFPDRDDEGSDVKSSVSLLESNYGQDSGQDVKLEVEDLEGIEESIIIEIKEDDAENLDASILSILGEGPRKERQGEKVHQSVAERLRNIISKGLTAEEQAALVEKYPSPENLLPLNQEIASSLTEQHRSRDRKLALTQDKLGASLSALSKALTVLLKEQGPKNMQLIELLEIYTDACLTGWGVSCKGETACGQWDMQEQKYNINCLELLASFFGLKCFASQCSKINILLRVDNTTAISYLNRMRGVKNVQFYALTRKIWQLNGARKNEAKYLGIWLDGHLCYKRHITEAGRKAGKVANALTRLMPNVGGPGMNRRRVIATAAHSVMLYGAEI
ncbi:hypothetical protein NQ315_015604 [Exocentrus adspersus]|uniref:Uncharacterized protein n=1 Tax=Exocentrus adspersus TaxID=1586481 RepID=A0AAV8V8E3_9CUCU|nr:hypothetical protein NQ315_015604 [Exocentrus adspersus]